MPKKYKSPKNSWEENLPERDKKLFAEIKSLTTANQQLATPGARPAEIKTTPSPVSEKRHLQAREVHQREDAESY